MEVVTWMALILTVVGLGVGGAKAPNVPPYEILNRHYESMGGLERLKEPRASYTEGTIDIVGAGLSGTFRQWFRSPVMKRTESSIGPLEMTEGNNGEVVWSVDQNGKMRIHSDTKSRREFRVDSLLAEFAHVDPADDVFDLSYQGVETAIGRECHVVEITNAITTDTLRYFIDRDTFLKVKEVKVTSNNEVHVTYADYREVDGVRVPFSQTQVTYPTKQKQEIVITGMETDIEIDPSRFDPPADDVSDLTFAGAETAVDIPFRFIENHIYLPVTMKGKERLWILDTGAEVTVIEKRFAREVGVESEGELKGRGAGKVVDFSFGKLPPLSISDRLFLDRQTGAVFDLYSLFHELLGLDVAGILGYDFLSRVVTRVDYANERITFFDPDSFSYRGSGVVLEVPISQSGSFDVPVVIDGKYEGLWHLDLGAGGMSFHYPFADRHGLLDRDGVDRMGFGAGGAMADREVKFETIEIAGFRVSDAYVDIPAEKGEGAFADSYLAGNIGNELLRHFVLYLDYKRGRVIVEKGEDFEREFPRDYSGLQVKLNAEDEMEVFFISPGSPSEVAGFATGDIIETVNGIPVEHLEGVLALRSLLKLEPGTTLAFGVVRVGRPMQISLTLADLHQ